MPLPFEEFQGKVGVLGLLDCEKIIHGGRREEDLCYVVNNNGGGFPEPTSVLDSIRSPSPFVSSSTTTTTTTTLSSSHCGGGGGGGPAGNAGEFSGKCDQMGFEDLDGQEQSILRLIMAGGGDVVDPGFVGFDPGSGSDNPSNPLFGYGFPFLQAPEEEEVKFTEIPNPGYFSVGSDPSLSPPSKRLNSGQPGFPYSDPGHPILTQQPSKLAGEEDESVIIIDQLFNLASELTGNNNNNPNLAQGILARLNHNLNLNSTNNKNPKPPFHRAASYITEALHTLSSPQPPSLSPPQTLILKIAAYRAFSETSPFLQFVNFTANQTILESTEGDGINRIHIVDFDIGFGSQYASLIQELAGRRRTPSLKITAFASPSTISDEFELRFTEENLRNFAGEIGVSFEIELLNIEVLMNPSFWRSEKDEAIAVNLPIGSVVSGYLPLILRFLKQISPNVVVCSDRTCDRNNDAPFPNTVIHALQYYTSLLESLDSSDSEEAVLSIERFCVQPEIERLLTNRYRWMEKSLPWRSLFGQCGFTPVTMSSTAETQAEYLLQRTMMMKGFHLEKRQSSFALCWQRKELVTVSAWKC